MKPQLLLSIIPDDGAPYTVDLSEFAEGRTIGDVLSRNKKIWGGDYIGRPKFAEELAVWFQMRRPSEQAGRKVRSTLRSFFRFLDEKDADQSVRGIGDLQDHHGTLLLRSPKTVESTYHGIKVVIDDLRRIHDAPPLFWPARPRGKIQQLEDIDTQGIRKLYRALKSEGHAIRQMFREGEILAAAGADPRGTQRLSGSARWIRRENHAYLVRELTRDRLLSKAEFKSLGGQGLNQGNRPDEQHDGPAYLVPGMSSRGREGIVGKLRWFHPSYWDTVVMLWLFLLGTGWNLSTALALDISADELWQEQHPQKKDMRVIHAWKGRSDRYQFALSMERPQWHPYQLVKFMIERTAPLRRTLEHEKQAIELAGNQLSPAGARRIAEITAALRSPWLYHNVNKIGSVNALQEGDKVNQLVGHVVRQHGLDLEHPTLLDVTTGDARDAWIGHAYVSSGFQLLVTQYAAQHKDLSTLKHYLNRHRYRAASESSIRAVQNAAFGEIGAGRLLDPTRLRMIVEHGGITLEQEKRLLDIRQRTRLGMGCLDPQSPPRSIAPDHEAGSVCRVQRCTGCVHGVVFQDSLDALARARAELIEIKATIPLAAFVGSSFEDEEQSLDATLDQFDAGQVDAMTKHWLQRIRSKEVSVHDVYPSY